MKHSIRFKITFVLTIMIVLTIFLTWFINRTFLAEYYWHSKLNNLAQAYQDTKNIYEDSEVPNVLSDDDTEKMEQLASNYNVDIYVINTTTGLSYPSLDNIGQGEYAQVLDMDAEYSGKFRSPYIENKTVRKQTSNYVIFSLYDGRKDANYIDLVGIIAVQESGKDISQETIEATEIDAYILLRANVESIEESVKIANNFLAYIGILAVIIGTVAMLFISKKFTRPILDLSGIAKKMSDLDFDV
ncbi:MAG: HAMP domain-containing protein, partial [Mobilitalea sp.]